MCWKHLRWLGGVPLSGTHLHELRVGQTFRVGGRRGKLVEKVTPRGLDEVVSTAVAWERVTRRYNVATRRYRTTAGWGKPTQVAPCMEVET